MVILLGLSLAYAGDAIVLRVEGLEATNGPLICSLYDREETWLRDTGYVATAKVPVEDGAAVCRFDGVPPGTYAVSFIQDVNRNDMLDTNWIGFPKEPWGVSRDAPVSFGPPKFEAAAFAHPGPEQVAHVR